MVKNRSTNKPIELVKMETAGRLVRATLGELIEIIRPGMSTGELDDRAYEFITERGGEPAPLGYHGYPKSICTSVNSVLAHGIPDYDEILVEGDIISIDVCLSVDGHYADACRTIAIGNISSDDAKLLATGEYIMDKVLTKLRENPNSLKTGDIGYWTNYYAHEEGVYTVPHLGGHGIGHALHTDPFVPAVGIPGHGADIRPGMYITIEPIITDRPTDIYVQDDGWSIESRNGAKGFHKEHTIAILDGEIKILV